MHCLTVTMHQIQLILATAASHTQVQNTDRKTSGISERIVDFLKRWSLLHTFGQLQEHALVYLNIFNLNPLFSHFFRIGAENR